MPPRRNRAPRSKPKPSMAAAKSMITKLHKKKAKKNMDTFFLKTKNVVVLSPSQGALTSNYLYQAFTLNPNNTTGTAVWNTNAEFNLYKLQYDKFRVNSVKITVKPKANVLDQANANNDTGYNVTGDGLIHTCIDRNGLAPASTAIISRYPSYRSYSVLKPFSRSYSIKYPTGVWLNTTNTVNFTMSDALGLTGGISMYAENFLEDNSELFNEPWAEVLVEYNIVFQGKCSNPLSGVYDASDNLVGVTINALPTSGLPALTPVRQIRGILSNDTQTAITETGDPQYEEIAINDLGQD